MAGPYLPVAPSTQAPVLSSQLTSSQLRITIFILGVFLEARWVLRGTNSAKEINVGMRTNRMLLSNVLPTIIVVLAAPP